MKSELFVKLLRKVIREEVQSVVRKELKVALNETKLDHKKVIDHGMDLHNIAEKSQRPVRSKKKFVKDSMLNDILNETATSADFSTMSDSPSMYQTSDVNSFASTRTVNAPIVENDVNGAPVNMANKQVAKTVGLMTKDYSALMKAIDKKKGR